VTGVNVAALPHRSTNQVAFRTPATNMVQIAGKYAFVSQENLDGYLEAAGIGCIPPFIARSSLFYLVQCFHFGKMRKLINCRTTYIHLPM
jgi:hypothetical protein